MHISSAAVRWWWKVDFTSSTTIHTMQWLDTVAFILVIVGGLNWLLLALTGWEVGQLFGGMDAMISQVVYILVGLSAIYLAVMRMKGSGSGM